MQNDVFEAVSQFFAQSWLSPNWNSNMVTLIPKFKGADKISDYRPIALDNFKFKIISKVLADRLAIVAPKIVSVQQKGFIKGRSILDCICSTSEAINRLDNRAFGGNIALKFAIMKAYCTVAML